MIIHWGFLIPGLFFGLIPLTKLLNTECRYLIFEDLWNKLKITQQGTNKRRRWWKLPMLWVDPIRGYVVADFLFRSFEPTDDSTTLTRLLMVALSGLLLMITVWVQTTGRVDERESLSPGGYMAGLICAMLPPMVAISALVMGVLAAIAIQSYSIGYLVATITMAGIGFFLMGKSVSLAITTVCVSLPMLLNWLRGTRLVTPMRL